MRYEIGSHFEYDYKINKKEESNVSWLPTLSDSQYTFSGRSAIELSIKNIKLNQEVKNVYMPSYCCKSMVDPFIQNNINVIFYEVYFEEGKGVLYNINLKQDCDIFFAMSYFGIEKFQHDSVLKSFKEKGIVIIEDITHRLLSKDAYSTYSDYIIASLRKWLPIATGGYVSKQGDKFGIEPDKNSNHLTLKKIQAMKQKSQYLSGEYIDKNSFLKVIADFESNFRQKNYRYKIDDISLSIVKRVNINYIKQQRRTNALLLYKELKKLEYVKMLVPNPEFNNQTPLFFPIMVDESERDSLRSYLIENSVYCPIHWPNTEINSSSINNRELSIICDQRYSRTDMEFIISIIKEWHQKSFYNKNKY